MNEKQFERIYEEAVCAGQSGGCSAIANFAPENAAKVQSAYQVPGTGTLADTVQSRGNELNYAKDSMNESRALPGGMLNSGQKTDYENGLEKRADAFDKAKSGDYEGYPTWFDKICGENGNHNYEDGGEYELPGEKINAKII